MNVQDLQKAYEEGQPIVPDSVYDAMNIEEEAIGPSGTVKHLHKMYSLKKVYNTDKVPSYFHEYITVCTPKLDGLAVALVYRDNKFVRAVTRGDGEKGIDVTKNIRHILGQTFLPLGEVQVTGEVVAYRCKDIPNIRNIVAGAVNLKSEREFREKAEKYHIKFIPYDCSAFTEGLWDAQMRATFAVSILDAIEEFYPTDGRVYRVNDLEACQELGYTQKEPKWAYAFKEKGEQKETKILGVRWQVGKGGKVTPVVDFEPIILEGAKIQKATLHNAEFVENLDLSIGDKILVERAGGSIPHVIRKVKV